MTSKDHKIGLDPHVHTMEDLHSYDKIIQKSLANCENLNLNAFNHFIQIYMKRNELGFQKINYSLLLFSKTSAKKRA